MKYEIIKLNDQHYIIVDDSEIKKGWVTNGVECFLRESMPEYSDEYANRYWKNITHSTQPLDEKGFCWFGENCITCIPLSEVEEAINGYSVEKMAFEAMIDYKPFEEVEGYKDYAKHGYIKGFKAHQELVKDKLFTIEDVLVAINLAKNHGMTGDEIIKSLLPKTEWEVEFDEQGKIKLI